jgi:hypothetical protein
MTRKAVTKKTTDHSDAGQFSFSFYCDRCGKEWVSPAVPFSGGVCSEVEHKEAVNLLWAAEHRAAFEGANIDAHMYFNLCPVCGKRVCDNCFCIEEKEHGGVCNDCLG